MEARFRRIGTLDNIAGMLHWDASVMMPAGAGDSRAEELATLAMLGHRELTDPALARLLEAGLAEQEGLDPWRRANLREMAERRRHAVALPDDLVEARSRAASAAEMAWRQARADDDFALLAPHLDRVLGLTREAAAAKAAVLGLAPYDALVAEYEPDVDSAAIDRLFDQLAARLPALLERVEERQSREGEVAALAAVPVEAQRVLGRRLIAALGFDSERGRLDDSLHPFTGGHAGDVRLTARYAEGDFTDGIMAVLHECGHALYEQGLPADWRGQPVGQARGMMLHESQSLFVEMQLARGRPFLGYLAGLLPDVFPTGSAPRPKDLVRHVQRVSRGFIRVEADELTYPFHVMLRTRLERAMLAGDLVVGDLPGVWRDGMRDLLGVVPPDDRQGVLQDIHWPDGAFGYFPTYTLGALAAAQLYRAADAALPDLDRQIADGDFAALIGWCRANVHAHGSRLTGPELLQAATGAPLSADAFLDHVERRYLG
nr:carboxypeptidase M32 [Oceanibacterium hippocampi]